MVSFADFQKLDIQIGKIVAAERVPDTDKLLKLLVDFGSEQRTIVSGIAECYTPESLVGKLAPFIVNLEPRVIKGIESQGMILAAAPDNRAVILKPHKKVAPGTKVR